MTGRDVAADVVSRALARLARDDSGRILAILATRFDDLDLADDAVQDALTEAAEWWPVRGVPDNPAGWLMTVARNKGIDRIRRRQSAQRRLRSAAPDLLAPVVAGPDSDEPEKDAVIDDEARVADEHLRLVLLCCHPALDRNAQVALTLRLVGGLTTREIAAAFLLPEATLAQRLVRAKRKIRDARIPLTIPAVLDDRVDALLAVLYLVFNEGYLTRGDGADPIRSELVDEAVRLTELALELLPGRAEVQGLLALELFHRARLASRLDAVGDLVLLADQDRAGWDRGAIQRADRVLAQALSQLSPGPYQLQAAIAGCHAKARRAADTDWSTIVRLYTQLVAMRPSPVVALNHAVAVAMADGPLAGRAALDRIVGLDQYHLWHAARGEVAVLADDLRAAAGYFKAARRLTDNVAEQRHLDRRLAACGPE